MKRRQPDGTRLVTASADKTAIVWDVASGNRLATLRGH
jgi:WD40 repeat protein